MRTLCSARFQGLHHDALNRPRRVRQTHTAANTGLHLGQQFLERRQILRQARAHTFPLQDPGIRKRIGYRQQKIRIRPIGRTDLERLSDWYFLRRTLLIERKPVVC